MCVGEGDTGARCDPDLCLINAEDLGLKFYNSNIGFIIIAHTLQLTALEDDAVIAAYLLPATGGVRSREIFPLQVQST